MDVKYGLQISHGSWCYIRLHFVMISMVKWPYKKGAEYEFTEKLIELRKKESLLQDKMGERLGVSRQTISKWELAQSYPDFQRLVAISDYFGLSLDELVKDVDVREVREKTDRRC